MFENDLKNKLSKIFGLRKISFDASGVNGGSENYEQDTLFVEINKCFTRPNTKGKIYQRVDGSIVIYANSDKIPYGFYNKKVNQAPKELTSGLFFFNMDREVSLSGARLINISERRSDFVFLYSGEYDPSHGELQAISFRDVNPLVDVNNDTLDTGDGPLET